MQLMLLTERTLAFAMALQAFELLLVIRTAVFHSVWSYENVGPDLERGLPLPRTLVAAVFGARGFHAVVVLQLLLAIAALISPNSSAFIALFITHLLICIRFRGSFNGGSDMMTFVVLTGVLISAFAPNENAQRLGLLYIAIQSIYSYIKAGVTKLRAREWRNGSALPAFFSQSLINATKRVGVVLRFKPVVAKIATWVALGLEIGTLSLVFKNGFASTYLIGAIFFHFAIYRFWGLNRFFWIWLATWPSIIYLNSII